MPGMCPSFSGMYPMRDRISSGEVVTSSPSTRIAPSLGLMKPSRLLIIVLLPAPLGPSRPTAPGRKLALTSRSAQALPYATLTPCRVTTASVEGVAGAGVDSAMC